MEKRADITDTVLHLLEELTATRGAQRSNVCIIVSRDARVAKAVSGKGHRLVVVGDRFKPLLRFHERNQAYNPVVTVEALYRELPLYPTAFDVLVVARPMPKGSDVGRELLRLRRFLKSDGTLMWLHPHYEGLAGKLRRALASKWYRMERHTLCRIAMENGFCQIGQELVRGAHGVKYVLTRATNRQSI